MRRRAVALDGIEQPAVQAERVANIVDAQAVAYMAEEKADDMAPDRERAGLYFDSLFLGKAAERFWHQVRRNKLAYLPEY